MLPPMPVLLLSAFAPPGSIAEFADHLVVHDLPGLPDDASLDARDAA